MDLNATAKVLDVAKRRIYDITNVLEGIGLLEKCSKNTIKWKGSGKKLSPEHEAEQQILMGRIKILREEDRALDAHITQVYDQIEEHSSLPGNKDLIYVTAEETQQANLYSSKTMIAIQAPTQTILEVPDPDELNDGVRRYHVYMKSTNGPIHTHVLNSNGTTSVETSVAASSSSSSTTSSSSSSLEASASIKNSSSTSSSSGPSKSSRPAAPQNSTMAAYKQVRRHGNVGGSSQSFKKLKTSTPKLPPPSPQAKIMPLPAGEDFSYDLGADEGIADFFWEKKKREKREKRKKKKQSNNNLQTWSYSVPALPTFFMFQNTKITKITKIPSKSTEEGTHVYYA